MSGEKVTRETVARLPASGAQAIMRRMVNRVQKFLATLALSGFAISGAAALSLSIERVQADDAVRATAAQSEPGLAQPAVAPRPVVAATWSVAQAQALLRAIQGTAMEGLNPADYQPEALRAAIAAGEGEELNRVATSVFTWLVEDYRDGHTPLAARSGYLMEDSDAAMLPTPVLMERALANGDVVRVFSAVDAGLSVQRQNKRVRVDGELTVRQGHDIAHAVKDALIASVPHTISDVTVHIEPAK